MRTTIPYTYLHTDSWAEDFTPSQEQRQKHMFIQCMGHYRSLPGYGVYDRSKLKSYLLLYTSHGCGFVRYLDKTVALPPGYATLIDCTKPHSYYCSDRENWDFRWIHFSGSCIEGYLSDFMQHWGIAANKEGTDFFKSTYELVKTGGLSSYIACSTRLINLCADMLLSVMEHEDSKQKGFSPMVQEAICIFEEEYPYECDLNRICEKLSVSKYYFLRTFRQQTGYTPGDYLITVRLNHAKSLLRSSSLTIEEIALECGFSTSSYFIHAFKKRENVTPLHYRKFFLQNDAE